MSLKIAHISDLHFGKFSLNPLQFFSKQWVGNGNLLLRRGKAFQPETLIHFGAELKSHGVQGVFITGDLTSTSSSAEFKMAKQFVESLKKEGLFVISIPGNHDHYTQKVYKTKTFYQYFKNSDLSRIGLTSFGPWTLVKDRLEVYKQGPLYLVALDTALATPLFSASGRFTETLEHNLCDFLNSIDQKSIVVIGNHFPLVQKDHPRNRLERAESLRDLLMRHKTVKLYLHGHNHQNCTVDLRSSNLPITLDSGSASFRDFSTYQTLELSDTQCSLEVFSKTPTSDWTFAKTQHFRWEP